MNIRQSIIFVMSIFFVLNAFAQPDGQEINSLYQKTYAFYLSKKYDTAMVLTNKLIALDSNNCKFYLLKGNILTERNKEAIENVEYLFFKSLKKNCDSVKIFLGLENLYFNKMVFDKALVYINKSIKLKPDSGYLYFRRASTKLLLNKPGMKADLLKAKEKGYSDAGIMLKTIENLDMK